jgi:antitoxin component of MazEF toxin-antitoxin module
MDIEVKTKKWGNSIGIIIPNEIVTRSNIRPEENIIIEIRDKRATVLKEMFGTMKSQKGAGQIIEEVRKDIESKWMK